MTTVYFFLVSQFLVLIPVIISSKIESHAVKLKSISHGQNNSNTTLDEPDEIEDEGWEYENNTIVDTRRILYSKRVNIGGRPYMVYLQLTKESAKAHKYRGWLCGGVIVHPSYVLTSAACVEDADHFYIVSGTTKFVDSFDYKNDDCVCKHRRKVVWKCIPKNYKFDFEDSIKWSSNDIAIVKVDKPFKLGVCEKGCEFATDLVCYNNVSRELEKPGTKGWIAGWGSGNGFREGVYRRQQPHIPQNAKYLQEAKVCIMDNEQCAKKWAQKFRSIIAQYMICTKDVMKRLSEICDKKYANCTDVDNGRRDLENDTMISTNVDLGRHLRDPDSYTARRSSLRGGFCENDHGGPLIVKYQGKERVIGVISACKIDPKSHSCHGPFLYTSVFKNRQFISCSINKDVEESCRRVFRTGITHEEWTVNWDKVDDDDDDQNERADSDEDTYNKREDKSSEESDDDGKDAMRQPSKDKQQRVSNKKEKKAAPKEEDDNSSASADTEEAKTKVSKTDKAKSEKIEEPEEISTGKHKRNKEIKHKRDKKHDEPHKREEKRKSKRVSKKSKQSSDTKAKGEEKAVSYESSKDDNVNEPVDE